MTAPAIWPGTGLDSIVFSAEERWPGCQFRECSAEALYEGTFEQVGNIPCGHGRVLYCLAHKDYILDLHRLHLECGNSFTCPRCPGSRSTLIRMEPIR
jgi:hypothetical protein